MFKAGFLIIIMQINKERVGSFKLESEGGYRDIAMLEDCDSAVRTICKLCGWSKELDVLVKGQQSTGGKSSQPSGGRAGTGGAVGGAKTGSGSKGKPPTSKRVVGSAYQTKQGHTHNIKRNK